MEVDQEEPSEDVKNSNPPNAEKEPEPEKPIENGEQETKVEQEAKDQQREKDAEMLGLSDGKLDISTLFPKKAMRVCR